MKRNYLPLLLLTVIFAIAVGVRFFRLGEIPSGLIDDEAVKGYDAYSLIKTGRDQWGVSWPLVSFKGFGDYRTPLYTYLTIPSIELFGLTPYAVRFPSALFGSLTILLTFSFVFELFRGKKYAILLALISSLLLALSPWHIGMSRIAHEATVAVFIVVSGLTVMLAARRKLKLLLIAGVFFALSLYVYPASTVFVPIIIALYILLFRKSFPKKYVLYLSLMLFTVFILSLPTLTSQSVRLHQVNLTQDSGMIDLLNRERGACTSLFSPTACRLVLNKYYIYFERFVTNYYYHFSATLLGISGTTTQYSILPPRGLLYLVELPLLLVGIFTAFRSGYTPGIFLVLFILAAAIPDSLTGTGHYGRFFISLPAWQILIAYGLYTILEKGKKYFPLLVAIVLLYVLESFSFGLVYLTYFPREYAKYSHYGYEELVRQIERYRGSYDKVVVSSNVNDAKQYIFYLFYTKYDPALFQKSTNIVKGYDSLGWVRVERIGSIYFVPELPRMEGRYQPKDQELLIGAPSEIPKDLQSNTKFTVKDLKGQTLFMGVGL